MEKLSQQIEQGAFHSGDGMDGTAQIECLQATALAVAGSKGLAHAVEQGVPLSQRAADQQGARVFQGLADFFAARHFTDAGVATAVGQQNEIAGEKGCMGAAQVEQHAVAPGHRDDAHGADGGRGTNGHRESGGG